MFIVSHLRAAVVLRELGLDYALILEQSTIDLWSQLPSRPLFELHKAFKAYQQAVQRWTVLQLSSYADKDMWRQVLQLLGAERGPLLVPQLFMRGAGAYLLSRRGAEELYHHLYNPALQKLDLSSLRYTSMLCNMLIQSLILYIYCVIIRCIDIDSCIFGMLLEKKGAILPPLFLDSLSSEGGVVQLNEYKGNGENCEAKHDNDLDLEGDNSPELRNRDEVITYTHELILDWF